MLKFKGKVYIFNIAYSDSISISFNYADRDDLADFTAYLQSKIMSSLTTNILNLRQNKDDYSIYVLQLTEMPLKEIHFYDEKIYKALKVAITNAIEKGIKVNILLYGFPGIGKSSTIKKVMKETDAVKIKIEHDVYIEVMDAIKNINYTKILLLDDIDIKENLVKTKENTKLLDLLDSDFYNVCIMTSNTVDMYPALKRSGRVEVIIKCELPTVEDIKKMYTNLVEFYKLDKSIYTKEDIENVSKQKATNGLRYTHAAVMNVCKLSMLYNITLTEAWDRWVESNKDLIEEQGEK